MGEPTLRRRLVEVSRHLYQDGHNAPGDGNSSVRLSSRYLLCTPTMRHKGELAPNDIVKVRLSDGSGVDGDPSSEIRMHLAIYRAREDVRAIVHGHSPHAVGLTVAGHSMENPVVPEAIQTMGGIPTVPYASPTTSDVADAVIPFALQYEAFILERHGTVALGRDLEQALSRLEVVEHTAKITSIAIGSGGARPIPEAEARKLRAMAEEAGILRKKPRVRAGSATHHSEVIDMITQRVLTRLK